MKNFKSATVSIVKQPNDAAVAFANSGPVIPSATADSVGSDPSPLLPTPFLQRVELTGITKLGPNATGKKSFQKLRPKKPCQEETQSQPKDQKPQEIFEISPKKVVFEFDELNHEYETFVSFTNKSKKSEFIHLAAPKSRFFVLSPAKGSKTTLKAAPGLSVSYKLTFHSEDLVDYAEDMQILTDYGNLTLPVHAHFSRGRLQLPPEVVIENCPVKGSASALLFLRNADATPCKWGSRVPEPFALSPCYGTVAADGGVLPVKVYFNAGALKKEEISISDPLRMPQIENCITFLLGPEGDRVQELPVRATLAELPVRLDQDELEFPRTFVTTQRQAVVRLINDSDHVVEFAWKGAYGDALTFLTGCEAHSTGVGAVEETDLAFDDPDFAIEPVQGKLYGKASREFTVSFRPHIGISSSATAFLDVMGLRKRLPLHLSGSGRGPECKLEFTKLNVGEVYVNTTHVYKMKIENRCCVEARYTVLPHKDTLYGPFFTFSPSKGVLQPGDADVITITFFAGSLGIVSESIPIHLHGSQDSDLCLRIRGFVVAPNYKLSVEEVDFGCVSYGFSHQRTFTLANTSQIAFSYHLKLPPSCPYAGDLVAVPATGLLQPSELQTITVTLMANILGPYETALRIFFDGVEEELWWLPVKAFAETPNLSVSPHTLNFGDCYVGYDYTHEVEVLNETALAAHVKLGLDNNAVKGGATIKINEHLTESEECKNHREVVAAHSTARFSVTVRMSELESLSCGLNLETVGKELSEAHSILLSARGIGPSLKSSVSELSFEPLKLLESAKLNYTIKNVSPIPAQVYLYFEKSQNDQYPVFNVIPSESVIQPKGVLEVTVVACLDDAKLNTDNLIVKNPYVPDVLKPIPVKAVGKGFALVLEPNFSLDNHLGDFFTGTAVERTFTLMNKGRREQEIQWLNVRGNRVKENSPPIVFKIKPERTIIRSRQSATFTICIFAKTEGTFSDTFALKQSVSFKQISLVRIEANFILPLIVYNTQSLSFTHIEEGLSKEVAAAEGPLEIGPDHDDPEVSTLPPAALIRTNPNLEKSFSMKNVTSKNIHVELRIREKGPFRIRGDLKFVLSSGGTRVIGVDFDPHYRQDCISHEVKNKVIIKFLEHPCTDTVMLLARLSYPVLELSAEGVDFGTIIRNTEARREITLWNPSTEVSARFEWKLQSLDIINHNASAPEAPSPQGGNVGELVSPTSSPESRGENLWFDFVPFKGCIPPGGRQVVAVVFRGVYGLFRGRALCQVQGGLSYPLSLSGSAVGVSVQCDHTLLDFGCMPFYAEANRTLTVTNPSRVITPFSVDLSRLRNSSSVRVSPRSGMLEGDRLSLTVTFSPRIPDEISEDIFITIGHFDPKRVTVMGKGLLNSIAITGVDPRVEVRRNPAELYEKAYRCIRMINAAEGKKDGEPNLYSTRLFSTVPPPPPFLDLAALEAERLAFCVSLISKQNEDCPDGDARHSLPRSIEGLLGCTLEEVSNSESCEKNLIPRLPFCRTMRRSSTSMKGTNKYILASYTLDFGHMTRNDVRTTKVRLTNTSSEPLFLLLDSKELANLPITISPMRVQALGSMASQFFEVTIDVATNYEKLIYSGDNTFEFAIDVKGGPVILLSCHCYVATPHVKLSETVLDFGDVLLGNVKIVPLTLTNIEAVPCIWKLSFRKHSRNALSPIPFSDLHTPGGGLREFWCRREKGVIPPHEKVTLDVCFAPLRAGVMEGVLQIRLVNSAKLNTVNCKGSGREMNVVMSPSPSLEFPVTSPFLVSHAQLRITNHEETPVEVVCHNLDSAHAEELYILSKILKKKESAFHNTNQTTNDLNAPYIIFPLRYASESLPHEVLDIVYEDLEDQLKQEATLVSEAGELITPSQVKRMSESLLKVALNQPVQKGKRKGSLPRDLNHKSTYTLNETSLSQAGPDTPNKHLKKTFSRTPSRGENVEENAAFDRENLGSKAAIPESGLFLFLGPPESGKTTQARYFEKELGCTLVELDPLVHSEAERDTANGEFLQNLITLLNTQIGDKEKSVSSNDLKVLEGGSSGVLTVPELFNRHLPLIPQVLTSLLQKHLEKAFLQPEPTTTTDKSTEADEKQSQPQRFVMDNLHCCLTKDLRIILRVLCSVCEALHLPLYIISLCVSEATIGLRRAVTNRLRCEEEEKSAHIDLLPEAAFEKLSSSNREAYNRRLKHLNECRRALNRETAEMERFRELLMDKPQDSIQKICRAEERTLMQGFQSGESSSRSPHRTPWGNNAANSEQQRQEPNWEQLNPLAAFKELYKYLNSPRFPVQLTSEYALQQTNAFFARLLDVDAEHSTEDLASNIIAMVSSGASDPFAINARSISLEKNTEEEGMGVSFSRETETPLKMSISKTGERRHCLSDFGDDPLVSKVGLWSFMDAVRLQALGGPRPIPFVRFFSQVEFEVQVPHPGKKTKAVPTVLAHAYEESTRWLIPAKSYVDLQVEFCCDRAGDYAIPCTFGIVGTQQSWELVVKALAAVPDICRDDKVIFPSVRSRLPANVSPSNVFLQSKMTYYFGSLLVPSPSVKTKRGERISSFYASPHTSPPTPTANLSEVKLTFANNGSFPCEVTFSFLKEKERRFGLTPNRLRLEVGETQTAVLSAAPESVGEITNTLIACVSENPTPWMVHLSCIGSRPSLTLDGRKEATIDLGRTILQRHSRGEVSFMNTSSMPIRWRFVGHEKLPAELHLSATAGILDVHEAQPLVVSFTPTTTCLHQITLQVQVSDANLKHVVYETLPILLKAEGHDVIMEWTREVDFSIMHVGETKKETIRLLNKGPYDVGYVLRYPKRLENVITLSSQKGVIRGMLGYKDAAIAKIEITAHFDHEGTILPKLGQLELAFFEVGVEELLYPIQIIPVRGEAWYTHFTLKPTVIDFGSCFANQRKETTFEIQNTGRFPLQFMLFNHAEGCAGLKEAWAAGLAEGPGAAEGGRASTGRSTAAKFGGGGAGGRAGAEADFVLGCFTVSPARGGVAAGETLVVSVAALPVGSSRICETLGLYVPQSEPALGERGVALELIASPATPAILADLAASADVETIFEEQHVVNHLAQLERRTRAYSKRDRVFSFGAVLLGRRVEERFRIANSSPLPCAVAIQLTGGRARGGADAASDPSAAPPDAFDLSSNRSPDAQVLAPTQLRMVLPPFESRLVAVAFAPAALERLGCLFLATVEGPGAGARALAFDIVGEGTLPLMLCRVPPRLFANDPRGDSNADLGSVSLASKPPPPHGRLQKNLIKEFYRRSVLDQSSTSTVFNDVHKSSLSAAHVLQLPLTLVGSSAARAFSLQNIGEIPADVRLSVLAEDGGAGALHVERLNEDVTMPVGAEESFEVRFEPTKPGKFFMRLCAALTENPFENKEILVEARSYTQLISFEGIDPGSTDYVDLGDCYLGNPKKQTFAMKNNTKEDIRFVWQIPPALAEGKNGGGAGAAILKIEPDVGHIFAGSVKTLTLTFTSHETAPLRKLLTCLLLAQSIKLKRSYEAWEKSSNNATAYENQFDEATEWDSVATTSKWVSDTSEWGGLMEGTISAPGAQYMEAGRRHLKRVMQPVPEPPYQLTDTFAISQELHIGYHCEVPTYELQIQQEPRQGEGTVAFKPISKMAIHFEPTMLYQRRIVSLRVRNTCNIALPFAFHIEKPPWDEEPGLPRAAKPLEELKPMEATIDRRKAPMEGMNSLCAVLNESNAPPPPGPEFSVEPAEGVVAAGEFQDVSIVFAPCVVDGKELTASMIAEFPFSTSTQQTFTLHGLGVCPLVHFQIPPSDYLTKHAPSEVGGDLNSGTTPVLEFLSRNLYTRTPIRFKVINPTKMNYTFEWEDLTDPGSTFSPFRCLTPSGHLRAEKQIEMGFEFCADELGVREARWMFNLIGQTSIPFLLVGKAVDPDVFLSTSKVNFGALILGSTATQTVILENRDQLPFSFAFDILEESEVLKVLSVKPTSGVVGPTEKVAIHIAFTPNDEMVYNIPLVCNIKKSSTTLSINVKGEGVCVHDSLMVEIPEIGRMTTTTISPDTGSAGPMSVARGEPFHLNLGRVQLDTCAIRRFVLSNNGQHPFNFKVLAPPNHSSSISLENCEGVVPAKETTAITLTYRPTIEETIQRYKLRLRIADRPAYQVVLHGTGYVPKIRLSFTAYNFGPRFTTMYNPNHEVTATLGVSNTDREPIALQLAFPEDVERIFQVEPSFLTLQPNETANVTVSFHPKEVRAYENQLKLTVNGAFPTMVPFRGEGEVPRVDVVNHFAKLGVARVGERRQVEVRLECHSRLVTPVSFENCIDADLIEKGISIVSDVFLPNTLTPPLGSTVGGTFDKFTTSSSQNLLSTILLKPRETKTITITFQPLRRMGEFQRKLRMQVCGREALFAVISGSCEGSEIHLDTSHVRFDDVVVGSSATRRLVIMNSGDIAQKFNCKGLQRGEGELSVHPMNGFLRSHTEASCVLTYSPQRAESVLQRSFEITFEDAPPLTVMVNGNAIARPAAKEVISFTCRARETDTQNVSFENTFGKPWDLEPVISNPLWSAPRRVVVKPFMSVTLPVTYTPMKPTTNPTSNQSTATSASLSFSAATAAAGVDLGTLFLPLPDGRGLTYALEGRAEPAGPVGPPISVEVEAKAPYNLSLKVENWAPTPLRFVREVSWLPELEEGVISLGGASTAALEIRAQSSKEAALTLTCMREGLYEGTIAFNCPENPDMKQYYEVHLKVLPPSAESVTTTELYAAVQTCAVHHLSLSNPLKKPVTFTTRLELVPTPAPAGAAHSGAAASAGAGAGAVDFLTVPPAIQVPAQSAASLPVQFVPLTYRPYPAVRLVVSSAELGVSRYVFRPTAAPQAPQAPTRLVCPLGQSAAFTLRFTYLGRAAAEFTASIAGARLGGSTTTAAASQAPVFTKVAPPGASFKVSPGAPWPRGQEVAVEFLYEPQSIGTVTEAILLSSPAGGAFSFPVVATCTAPRRQGPVLVRPDAATPIAFRNVFAHPLTIAVAAEPAQHFLLAKRAEVVAPKKSTSLLVQCRLDDGAEACHGRLVVACQPPGAAEPIEWVYYLEGRRAEGGQPGRRSTIQRKK